jgi:hypothetical protein
MGSAIDRLFTLPFEGPTRERSSFCTGGFDMFHLTGIVQTIAFSEIFYERHLGRMRDAQRPPQPASNAAPCPILFIYRVIGCTYRFRTCKPVP